MDTLTTGIHSENVTKTSCPVQVCFHWAPKGMPLKSRYLGQTKANKLTFPGVKRGSVPPHRAGCDPLSHIHKQKQEHSASTRAQLNQHMGRDGNSHNPSEGSCAGSAGPVLLWPGKEPPRNGGSIPHQIYQLQCLS